MDGATSTESGTMNVVNLYTPSFAPSESLPATASFIKLPSAAEASG